MKKGWAPGCLGFLVGDEILSTYMGIIWDYFIKHEIRILIKQPVFHGK